MSAEEGLLPIGRLARLSRLSVKALRRYADDGLLEPAWVDPTTGYRWYRREQVREAAVVALLRSLDVPLAAVRQVLAARGPGELERVLQAERARLEREVARRRTALRSIERLLAAGDVLPYPVEAVEEPPSRVLGLTRAVDPDRLDVEVGALAGEVAALAAQRAWPAAPFVGLYPLDLAEPCPVTVGVRLPAAGPTPATGGAREHALPGGPALTTVHVGPYDELPLAYAALLTAVHERGGEPRGPVVETYLTHPAQAAPGDLVTRLAVPVG